MNGDGAALLLMPTRVGGRCGRLPIRGGFHGAVSDGVGLAFGRNDMRNQNGFFGRGG